MGQLEALNSTKIGNSHSTEKLQWILHINTKYIGIPKKHRITAYKYIELTPKKSEQYYLDCPVLPTGIK